MRHWTKKVLKKNQFFVIFAEKINFLTHFNDVELHEVVHFMS